VALIRVFEIYGAGWMAAFTLALVHFYRKNVAGELFLGVKSEIEKSPELKDHFDSNIHDSKTKVHAYIVLGIIAVAFALSSLWPFVLGLRLYHLVAHRDRDSQD
jgi:hypothetical protein